MLAQVIFAQRKKGVAFTDQRVRLTFEVRSRRVIAILNRPDFATRRCPNMQVLSGIRLIKFYAWETFYARQIAIFREREVKTIRRSS